jgi:YVTN family beta-propeller protein
MRRSWRWGAASTAPAGNDAQRLNPLRRGWAAPWRSSCRLLALGLVLLLAACPAPDDRPTGQEETSLQEPAELAGTVFSADEEANAVTMLDVKTGQARQVPLTISPHNIQVTADGSLLLLVGPLVGEDAAGHVHDGDGQGRLVVLDAGTLEEARPPMVAGDHPAHVVVDAGNRFAYITDAGPNSVLVMDLQAGRVIREIPTCAYPHGLRLSPDGRELYVACVQSDEVAVIDVGSGTEAARIEVGRAPVQVGFTADGGQVWVSLRDENAVAAIETNTREVVARVAVGRGPIQVFGTPDGRYMYVANEGRQAQPDNTVSVVDVAARQVATTITTDAGAHGVVVSPNGQLVFISNLFAGTVSVIEVANQRVVASYPVGEGPAGITYRPGRR